MINATSISLVSLIIGLHIFVSVDAVGANSTNADKVNVESLSTPLDSAVNSGQPYHQQLSGGDNQSPLKHLVPVEIQSAADTPENESAKENLPTTDFNHRLQLLEEKIATHDQYVSSTVDRYLSFSGLLLTIAALLAGGGLTYSFFSQLRIRSKGKELLKQGEGFVSELESKREEYDKFIDEKRSEGELAYLRRLDSLERRFRSLFSIRTGEFDSDQIFADLTHLTEVDDEQAKIVAAAVMHHDDKFDEEVSGLAQSVLGDRDAVIR